MTIKPFSFTENLEKLEKEAELTPADKIHKRIEEIDQFIEERQSVAKYEETFREFNVFTIQEKIKEIGNKISSDSAVTPIKGNHFYHTLGNLQMGLRVLDRIIAGKAGQDSQTATQKNIMEISLYLKELQENHDFFQEALETQHGHAGTLQ